VSCQAVRAQLVSQLGTSWRKAGPSSEALPHRVAWFVNRVNTDSMDAGAGPGNAAGSERPTAGVQVAVAEGDAAVAAEEEGLVCEYCGKRGHRRTACFKLMVGQADRQAHSSMQD
jgi:hypothetical protein